MDHPRDRTILFDSDPNNPSEATSYQHSLPADTPQQPAPPLGGGETPGLTTVSASGVPGSHGQAQLRCRSRRDREWRRHVIGQWTSPPALAGSVLALARSAAADLVVSGTVYKEREQIVVRAQVSEVASARILASLDPVSAPAGDAMLVANPLSSRIAGALAAALDARLTSITLPSTRPPNFEAAAIHHSTRSRRRADLERTENARHAFATACDG